MMTFLWNLFAKVVWFCTMIIFEGFLYYIFREVMIDYIGGFIYFFDLAFVIWIIAEAIVRIVSGGAVNLFRWLIGRFL
jgi:hypothetical protein